VNSCEEHGRWLKELENIKGGQTLFFSNHVLSDPQKTFGKQGAGMAGQWWPTVAKNPGNDMVTLLDVYPFESFSATPDNATVAVGTFFFVCRLGKFLLFGLRLFCNPR
jgi:hypothetical protein